VGDDQRGAFSLLEAVLRRALLEDVNYSCVVSDAHRNYSAAGYINALDIEGRYPGLSFRLACYPIGFKTTFANPDDYILHIYSVPPILEKEPLRLEDSRLWC
jgi:hypothetical protein